MAKLSLSKDYKQFLTEIKEKVYRSQYQAMRKVNKELIGLYWYIGQTIVARQSQFKWGKAVVETCCREPFLIHTPVVSESEIGGNR